VSRAGQGLTLDAGALIALDRHDERVRHLLRIAQKREAEIAVPAGVVAQAWRGGPRQAHLAMLLDQAAEVVSLDHGSARAVGVVACRCGHPDVVDVSVVVCARQRGHRVVTSDPGDLRRVDPGIDLIAI
jgi:hypothetical protein